MHELRTAILTGDVATLQNPVARKERCRRQSATGSLIAVSIPRVERRTTNQRREDRFPGVVERATIIFRRKKRLVRVVNLSRGGAMIECNILPMIGEEIGLEFENGERVSATVRWVREGRVGLDAGESAIEL
jgi:hypothetical protein